MNLSVDKCFFSYYQALKNDFSGRKNGSKWHAIVHNGLEGGDLTLFLLNAWKIETYDPFSQLQFNKVMNKKNHIANTENFVAEKTLEEFRNFLKFVA